MVTLERDPDADDVSGLSATKAREAAKENDFERFSEIVPEANEKVKHNLFNDVREGLKIK
jgi:citrate lyase synthetase